MANLSSSVSAHARNDEAPQLDDFYFQTYIQAWPLVEKLFWGDEIERAKAQKQMRRINSDIEKLNRQHGKRRDTWKIDIDKYSRIGEKLLKAAINTLTTGDDSEYIALRQKYNESFQSRGFPDSFCIRDDDFLAFCQYLQPMVQKARDDYSSDLTDVPDEEDADAEQYTEAEQDIDRREELENVYSTAGLGDHHSLPAEEHDPQEPSLESGEATDEADDEYDDDGFFDQSPQGPSRKDPGFWETHYVSFEDLLHDTQKVWGSLMTEGEILAYRLQGRVGFSVIVGYECDGRQIARLEAAARRPIPKDAQHISEISKARKPIHEDKKRKIKEYRNRAHVRGLGLVAWRVEGNYETDPTSVLRPSRKAWYPETYIQVYWADSSWSWESRDGLRFVYGGDSYRVDIIIYRQAISQEADFQEALTGHRPEFPDGGPMANKHWRNENAYGGAFWLQPRARKNKRVVKIEEEGVENVKSEDEDGLWTPAENGASQPFANGLESPGGPPQESSDAPSNWDRANYGPSVRNVNTGRSPGGDSQNVEAFQRHQAALPHRLRTDNIAHTELYQGTQDRGLDSADTQERNSATHQTPYESASHRTPNSAPPERRRLNPGPSRRSPSADAPRTQQRNASGSMQGRRSNSEAARRSGPPPNAPRTPQGNIQGLHGNSPGRNLNTAPLRMQNSTTPRGSIPPSAPNIRQRQNHHTRTSRQSEPPISTPRNTQGRDTNTPRPAASQPRVPRNAPSSPRWRNSPSARQASDPSSASGIRNRSGGTTSQFPGRQKRSDIPVSSGRMASRGGPQVPTRRDVLEQGSGSRSAQPSTEGRRRVKVV